MTVLVVLTVVDIVLLIAGLAFYLYWVGTLLDRIAGNLEECADIVRTIVGHAKLIGPGVEHINQTGGVVAGALPLLYGMAEDIVTGVTPAPSRPRSPSRRGPPPAPAAPACSTRSGSARLASRARIPGPRLRVLRPGCGADEVVPPIHSSFQAWSYCCSLQLGR